MAGTPENPARRKHPDWRAYYELLCHLGGSQTDIARLTAEDIDWDNRSIAYSRIKTGSQAVIRFDALVEEILKSRPTTGYLFPNIALWKHSDRAKAFIRRCKLVGVSGISLHSYPYSWAERAKKVGYPERFAQQALGHNSKAVHRAYARRAEVQVPPLGEYERKYARGKERETSLAGAQV